MTLKDNLASGYLPGEDNILNFNTHDIVASTYVDATTTGSSYYNSLINGTAQSLKSNHLLQGFIVHLTARQYAMICSKYIFCMHPTVEEIYSVRKESPINYKLYKVLTEHKKQVCLPWINVAEPNQEGLHRLFMIESIFGKNTKNPILIIDFADSKLKRWPKIACTEQLN